MFKKLLFILGLITAPAYGAMETRLDRLSVGSYLNPFVTGETLGTTTLRWSVWASTVHTSLGTGYAYIDSSGVLQRLAFGASTTYARGDGTIQTLDTSVVPENGNLYYSASHVYGDISGSAPISFNNSTGAFSCVVANGSVAGCLSAASFNVFNGKQAALGFTPEDVANKSTSTSLGTSDTLYPSQKAVKAYVDAHTGGSACAVLSKSTDYTVLTSDYNSNGCLMLRVTCAALCTITANSPSGSGYALKIKRVGAGEVDINAIVDGDSTGIKIVVQYTGLEIDDIGGSEWSLF